MDESRPTTSAPLPTCRMRLLWDVSSVPASEARAGLEAALAAGLPGRRWFGSKTRSIRRVRLLEVLPLGAASRLVLVQVEFDSGPAEVYQLPLSILSEVDANHSVSMGAAGPSAIWARVEFTDTTGSADAAVLVDALVDPEFCSSVLQSIDMESRAQGDTGELAAWKSPAFDVARGDSNETLPPRISQAEQSNSSVIYGDRLILKLFRRLETGVNPDLELNAHLTARGFAHVPPLAGAIEYRRAGQDPWALAVLQTFVPNQGDAWRFTLNWLRAFLDRCADASPAPQLLPADGLLQSAAKRPLPKAVEEAFGPFLTDAQRLGQRTAEMHLALADGAADAAFAPELITLERQREVAERWSAAAGETFDLLRKAAPRLVGETRRQAEGVLAVEGRAQKAIDRSAQQPLDVELIRIHGDYHLGQVLVTAGDFVIIDFEGEPARPLAERRKKALAMRDVAGMIRSFHYASCTGATQVMASRPAGGELTDRWASAWYHWSSAAFLAAYRRTAGDARFVPRTDEAFQHVLDACLLEKALYELRYELNNRPDWVYLPLAALEELLS